MNKVLRMVLPRIVSIALASCLFSGAPAFAEPASAALGDEFAPVIAEIRAMIKTDTSQVENFVVRAATPDRIEKLFQRPEVTQLPRNVRENGLIFAGLGSSLLAFAKPSDIIAKVSKWFPVEVARARGAKDPRFFGHLHLWGPYENWDVEPAAFLSLWNCMPQNAWLRPDRNPFVRRLNDGIPLYPIAARQSSYEEFDFGFCVHKRSGYRPSWTTEDVPRNEERLRKTAESVAPLLRSKFASFLNDFRCRGTGPDDCVLVLRLWASLAPADVGLAAALQALEVDVAPDGPLPELLNPKAAWSESRPEDGQDRFDLGLRRAAFLRAKLQSVLGAPQAWPADALTTTLRQLSHLRRAFAVPFVHRWYQYELDYRNDPINPWRIFDSTPDPAGGLRAAVLSELERLAEDGNAECEVFDQWFRHGEKSLQTEHVLARLRRAGKRIPSCGAPDFAWLRQQTETAYRYVLYGYLALLEYLPTAEQEILASGLTDNGDLCAEKAGAAPRGWLRQICDKRVPGRHLLRERPR
ncbi:MAG: hypothetical protein Q7U97_00325 [Rhodocyclaceae bacterium]|nr:hypothetical protein [Rhodocyclaceae bacterium]